MMEVVVQQRACGLEHKLSMENCAQSCIHDHDVTHVAFR
jgi:hypothetical protein